jgi:hypothetical protein
MIALASDFLMFKLPGGEVLPFSAEMISVELVGDTAHLFDPDFVRHAAQAVFYYFKHELQRETVTVSDFGTALEKVLHGFELGGQPVETYAAAPRVIQADLGQLARESGKGCELFFFPRLREELRSQLRQAPAELRFSGLRGCVKRLTGARRWSARCQQLQDRIVDFLRHCFTAEQPQQQCALLVQ